MCQYVHFVRQVWIGHSLTCLSCWCHRHSMITHATSPTTLHWGARLHKISSASAFSLPFSTMNTKGYDLHMTIVMLGCIRKKWWSWSMKHVGNSNIKIWNSLDHFGDMLLPVWHAPLWVRPCRHFLNSKYWFLCSNVVTKLATCFHKEYFWLSLLRLSWYPSSIHVGELGAGVSHWVGEVELGKVCLTLPNACKIISGHSPMEVEDAER